ncbi:hypothetical protein AB0873_01345 [Micromonospora sp. NPDC047707]|uniref:hypothetical protein n=1 Tax=unclassified Micromonospora TaxID=2617518 RepID=UPI0012B4FBFE|nr:hypothetical protein [Micromonospora sp. WMMC415]QGN50127.1 hypothetical protein GKC29_27120 [Micromonospora sp. WMMC415]
MQTLTMDQGGRPMCALPVALPRCGESATLRLEIYSASGGERCGSLDASAYTCGQHGIPMMSAFELAGLTARRVPLAPDVWRPCGYVYVYQTGALAAPAGIAHPHWCDRHGCDQSGRHRSIRLPVNSGHPDPVIVDVALTHSLGGATQPTLSVTAVHDRGQEIVLSLGQARVLCHQVRRLLNLARIGRRL